MRPIHLEFSGLRSYRGHAEIDFSTYDLFAIIGDTGAGKSTIIEALSLALYAKKTWSGGASLAELIADGQNTMTIRLRFAGGGEEWEVTRTRHRNASAPVDRLVGLTTGEHIDNAVPVSNRISEIVGLTHDQFTRAVVMPQGRFDELLTAKATERNKILRSIFGLDELERVRELARSQRTTWEKPLAVHADRRRNLPADPDADVAAAREKLVAARTAHAARVDALAAADEALAHLGQRDLVERLAKALSAVPADTSPAVGELERSQQRGEALLAERAEAEATKSGAAAEMSDLSIRQIEMLAGFADRDTAIRATGDLAGAMSALARAISRSVRLDEIEASLAEPVEAAALEPFERAVDEADEALRAATTLRDEANRQARAVDEVEHRVADLEAAVATTETDLAASTRAHEDADARRLAAADRHAGAADELAQHEAEVEALKQRHAAADLSHGHGPGDPCPVCDRPLEAGFKPLVVPDLDEANQRARRSRQHELDAGRALREAETAAQVAAAGLAKAREAHERAIEDHRRHAAVLAALDVPAVDQAETAVAQAEAERRAAVDARSSAAADHEQQQAARLQQVAAIEKGRTDVADDLATVAACVDALPSAWSDPIDVAELTVDGLEAARGSIEQVVDQSAELGRLLEAARAREREAATRLAAISNEAGDQVTAPATAALNRVREHVQAVISVRELTTEVDGDAVVPEPPAPAESVKTTDLAETVSSVEAALFRCAEIVEVGAGVAEARQAELDEWGIRLGDALAQADVASVDELRTAAADARSLIGVLDGAVTAAEARREEAMAADAVLAVVGPLVANLSIVEEALRDRAGRFIDHLVGARERELLAEASRRLKTISSGRHGFVADFGVASIASGEVRPPDALSGGERFQAALALALALVEIASRGGGQLDAVFVDEGFGSLDSAALDTALETLGGVAGGGKMVGLISHLRPVAEYVDTVLHVTKDDTEGSRIRPLDPEARERLLDAEVRSGLTE